MCSGELLLFCYTVPLVPVGKTSSRLGLRLSGVDLSQESHLVQLRTHPDQSGAGVVHAAMLQVQSVAQIIHSWITGRLLSWISNTVAFNNNPPLILKSMENGFICTS